MIASKRTRLSASQRVEVWRRWKAGESLHGIGRALGKAHPVIHLLLKRHGGIAPLVRRRSPTALTLQEREDISRGIACGSSIRAIAKGLDLSLIHISSAALDITFRTHLVIPSKGYVHTRCSLSSWPLRFQGPISPRGPSLIPLTARRSTCEVDGGGHWAF